jgi:integrase
MASVFRPTYTKNDPKTGKKVKKKLRKWYVRYRDADGIVQTVCGYRDKEATKQLAARLERNVARQQEGIFSPQDTEQKRLLKEHLEDFHRYLSAKGNVPEHVAKTVSYVRATVDACRFHRITDIQPSKVVEYLSTLRQPVASKPLVPAKDSYTAGEVAALLEIKVESVHRLVKRGHLKCQGRGRTKQFQRDDVGALLQNRGKGIGAVTSNHYLVAIKQFTRWLLRDRRAATDPLAFLSRQNPDVDVRHERRALPEQAFNSFVEVTANGKTYRGLTGVDRLVLYTLAAHTGFRAKELGSLEPASFQLDVDPPTVKVAAAYSKHRREDLQPVRPDVAELMRQYVAGKAADVKLWPGTWVKTAAEMVRMDLKAAGIPYKDAASRYFDFHAIRGQFISFLAAKGVHPKVAQVLARHSTITLTMDYYTHLDVLNVTHALEALPGVPQAGQGGGRKATG